MAKDLTNSSVDRQNILNNSLVINEIERYFDFPGYVYNNQRYFTTTMLAAIFDVDLRTIERLLENNREELSYNGFQIITGYELAELKKNNANVNPLSKSLAIFNFRALLNVAMLLTNSEKAKFVRAKILDITLDVITAKTQGQQKYINQRDRNYLRSAYKNETSRRKFTTAINQYVDMGPYKYEYFTNKIYKCIFRENATTYQRILQLSNKSNLRDTMYAEILTCITTVEEEAADEISRQSHQLNRMLTKEEATKIIDSLSSHRLMIRFLEDARTKMASWDLGLRDAYHNNLEEYITSVDPDDFERFLGERSKALEDQIKEYREVFLRLKDK
jgi:ciab protein|nr:MAG TPA: hypothetical protein [Caudoviricetes sp.]